MSNGTDWTPDHIRQLRDRLGWSQADLAAYLRLPTYDGSAPRVADLESGRRDPSGPVTKLLDQLADKAE